MCTRQRPRCAHARATMQAGQFMLSNVPCQCVVATQCLCMGRWIRHRRGPTAHAAGGANACGCTLKLAQEWRQMRFAAGETARKDADGASECRDNDTALSIARLRAARGTGIYEQFLPPCHLQRAEYKQPTPTHTSRHFKSMKIALMTHAQHWVFTQYQINHSTALIHSPKNKGRYVPYPYVVRRYERQV